jgi:protease I
MRLQGRKIATLVAEGVEDLEYYVPLMRLQEEGAQVLTAGLDLKTIHGKNGLEIKPDTRIDELNSSDLYALIVPGGWAPDKLRRHEVVKELVRQMNGGDCKRLPRYGLAGDQGRYRQRRWDLGR